MDLNMEIGSDQCSKAEFLDDLNSCLNVLFESIKKDTTKFPPLDMLDEIKQNLENLACSSNHLEKQRAYFVSISWPADFRIVLSRLFRTFKIPEEYTKIAYELSNFGAQCLGTKWLKADSQFLRLLASLSSGRLRVILDKPSNVDMGQLIVCIQLQEFFIKSVENEQEGINDDDATFVGKCCQEAATFICEYMIECAKQININMEIELFLVLYRFICAFLAIGGALMLNKELLVEILPTLVAVCKYCLSQRDIESAWFFLNDLPELASIGLPDETLSLLMRHIGLVYSTPNGDKQALVRMNSVLEQLKDYEGWFTEKALNDAEKMAMISDDRRLMEFLQYLRRKRANKEDDNGENK